MLGAYERPFCIGASCRRISYGPDCAAKCRSKRASKRVERREWLREYEDDELDFAELRYNTGWFFHGSWAWSRYFEDRYGDVYNAAYAEFGVTPSGWPVRRVP